MLAEDEDNAEAARDEDEFDGNEDDGEYDGDEGEDESEDDGEDDADDEVDADDDDPRRRLYAQDSLAPNLVPEEKPRNVLAGRIEILELIGQGGMGAVWRGYHLKLERSVAVKVLDETLQLRADGRERFIREARALAHLDHPGVVRVYDCDELDGKLYLCMELLEGETLRDLIQRERLDALDVIDLGCRICDAVGAAHERGILHRDLSPSNIIRLRDKRTVKILDWGLCKYLDFFYIRTPPKYPAPPGSRMVTPLGARFGTPEYMAPEMILRDDPGPPSFRTDVYALGVVLYELLTGRHPFAPGDRRAPRPIREMVPSFEDVELEAALRDAVRFDPDERTQTMAAFRQALERAGESITARRATLPVTEVDAESVRAVEPGPSVAKIPASVSATCLADSVVQAAVLPGAAPRPRARPSRSIARALSTLVVGAGVGVFGTIAMQQLEAPEADPAETFAAQLEREAARVQAAETRAVACEEALTAEKNKGPKFDDSLATEVDAPTAPPEEAKPRTEILASRTTPRTRSPRVVRDETFAQVMRRLTPKLRECARAAGVAETPITVQVRHKGGVLDAVRVRQWSQDHAVSLCIESVIGKAKPPPSESPVEEFTFFAGRGPATR